MVSLADAQKREKTKYGTLGQTSKDFHEKQRVRVIALCQDFHFFSGDLGTIINIKKDREHLCIDVRFDEPRIYAPQKLEDSPREMKYFSFDPEDLCDERKANEIDEYNRLTQKGKNDNANQ